jgi:Xaa-Pro aminopeptidase
LYELVLGAQQAALAVIRPGATFMAIHNAALRHITEGLKALGLIKGDVEEALREKRFQPFYMHGTGHWLGLDVHDSGRYKIGDEPRVLQPGMVFTVEPGVYVAEDAEDVDAHYKGIGVRIEDDILVTATGYENLTAAAPKETEAIEQLMASAATAAIRDRR